MSVGKTSDDVNVPIFTKDGVTLYKEEDLLITCQRKPILIGKIDERVRYRIPLTQDHRQQKPHRPTNSAGEQLQMSHSVYDLPSKEESINWIHTVCGYSFKSTWIKSIKAGNYVGCQMLTERNVARYYPETNETPKGHLNQSRKISGPTDLKALPSRCPKNRHYKGTRHVTYKLTCKN